MPAGKRTRTRGITGSSVVAIVRHLSRFMRGQTVVEKSIILVARMPREKLSPPLSALGHRLGRSVAYGDQQLSTRVGFHRLPLLFAALRQQTSDPIASSVSPPLVMGTKSRPTDLLEFVGWITLNE